MSAALAATAHPVRVMIVDDSAVVRGMVTRWLEDAGFIIAAIAVDGAQALRKLSDASVDVCLLDIEMPVMSGLEALPKLLAAKPDLRVIMASTLTERGAEVTLRALDLGAADYIAKPSANKLGGADLYRKDLIEKVRHLGARAARPAPPPAAPRPSLAPPASGSAGPIEAVVVASSTGGPPALRRFIAGLGADWTSPILIAQHMPPGFTRTLAQMLDPVSHLTAREARNGEPILPGVIYVAPGDYHMTVRSAGTGGPSIHLDQGPEVNYCRPSADPLFESAARFWKGRALGVVLTGMGRDGRDGAAVLAKLGGAIIAQDEATSVVWGMPGAVANAGLAEAVLPLDQIGPYLASKVRSAA